jgi:hypothetical protein
LRGGTITGRPLSHRRGRKAFLLAADDKITDPSIMRQIRG